MVSPRGQPASPPVRGLPAVAGWSCSSRSPSCCRSHTRIYALTVRDTSQIPLLASGAVVVGIAFGALALYSLSAVWRAGTDGRGGRAILLGIVGGVAAMVAAGCLAVAVILFMLAGSS